MSWGGGGATQKLKIYLRNAFRESATRLKLDEIIFASRVIVSKTFQV